MGLLEGVIAGLIAHGSASAVTKTHDTIRERSPAGDDVSETFDHTLTRSIEERAEEIDSHGLRNVVRHWGAVTEEIDTYEIVFASEEEALNWIVDEIAEHEWIDLTESEQRELRTILADEYADAVAAFHDHVAENERLQRRFQTDMGTALVEQLDAISQAFDRIAGPTPYEIHDFPAGREAITDTLLAGDPIPFVDRTEVPEEPKPNRYFVLGPSGSGKSRVIVEFIHRLPGDAVNHVLIPDNRMIDPSDAKALAHESFDGDLLLVWENVHRIDEGRENRVLERTLRELDQALAEQGHELYTLLEARSGQLHAVPGNLPADFENKQSLWSGFEQLRVEQLEPDRLRSIIDVMATEFGVALDEQAKDALVERTVDSESAPIYVETALVTARDRITADDIERLAEDVADIWQRQYATLRDEKPQE